MLEVQSAFLLQLHFCNEIVHSTLEGTSDVCVNEVNFIITCDKQVCRRWDIEIYISFPCQSYRLDCHLETIQKLEPMKIAWASQQFTDLSTIQ